MQHVCDHIYTSHVLTINVEVYLMNGLFCMGLFNIHYIYPGISICVDLAAGSSRFCCVNLTGTYVVIQIVGWLRFMVRATVLLLRTCVYVNYIIKKFAHMCTIHSGSQYSMPYFSYRAYI